MKNPFSKEAFRIALIYLLISSIYIIVSDNVVEILANINWVQGFNPSGLLSRIQSYKGIGYVLTTSLLIFFILRHEFRRYELARTRLAESEAKYQSLFEGVPIGLYRTTPDGEILEVNQVLVDMLNFPDREALLSRNTQEGYLHPAVRSQWQAMMDEQDLIENFVSQWRRQDGSSIWVEESARAVRGHDGQLLYYEGAVKNISDRRLAETELLENKRQLATLMGNLPGMAYRCKNDSNWTMEFVSEGCKELTGFEPYQLINNREVAYADIIDPRDRQLVWENVQNAQREQPAFQVQYRIISAKGEQKWVWEQGQYVSDETGQVVALEGFITDISDRVKAHHALEASKDRYRRLVENLNDLTYRYELVPERRFSYVSPSAVTITGFTPEEHYADPDLGFKLIHPDDRPLLNSVMQDEIEVRKPIILRWKKKDGSLIWTEQRNLPIHDDDGKLVAIEGIARDITDQVEARHALRESEEIQLAMLAASPLAIFSIDLEGNILFWSEAAERMFGWTAKEVIGKPLPIIPPGKQEEFDRLRRQAISGKAHFGVELLRQRKDGSLIPISLSTTLMRDETGVPFGIMSILEDISDRKKAATALRESEERYRLLAETMPDIIILLDMQDKVLYINQAGLEFIGFEEGQVIGKSIINFIPQEYLDEINARRDQSDAGEVQSLRYEAEFYDGNKTRVPVEIDSTPVFQDGEVTAILIVARDITERKQVEKQIQNKLAQLRALHEIDKAISSTLELNPLLEVILQEITNVVRCNSMSIQILRDENLEVVAGMGFDSMEQVLRLTFPLDRKFPNVRVIEEGIPITFDDVSEEYPHFKEESTRFESGHIRSWLGVPLIAGDMTIGMLTLDRVAVEPFTPDEIEIAQLFAAQTAIALQNAELYQDLKRSEENYRGIFEGIQDAIYVEAMDGSILDVNDRACELYGYEKEEFLQLNVRDFVEQETPPRERKKIQLNGYTGNPIASVHRRADWQLFPVEVSIRIQEITGETVILNVVRDISERREAEEQIQQHLDRLEALRQIDQAIIGIMDLEETLEILLKHLTTQLDIDAACILLVNSDTEELEYAASCGFRSDALRYTSLEMGEGYAGQVAREKTACILADLDMHPEAFKESKHLQMEDFKSYYAIPLASRDDVTGVLELFHRSSLEPDDDWKQFLEMITTQGAIAIDSARLLTQLQKHSAELEIAVENATQDLRDSRDQLEAILNSSPDAVLLLSPDGKIEIPNEAVRKLFGYDPEDLIRQRVTELIDTELAEEVDGTLKEMFEEETITRLEGFARQQDGTSFDAEVFLTPILTKGNISAVVCTIRDVTAWQELQRMKDAFVSNVSHELRTPITSLRLNFSLLRRDPTQSGKYLDRLDREINRLNELIEDLLRLSRLESGTIQLQLEDIDLNQLTGTTVDDRVLLASASELELVHKALHDAQTIQGDENLLSQALSVLLTNAINYTPAGGHIEVGVISKSERGDDWMGFYVQDDGPGIVKEDLPHIFERFYRGGAGRTSGAPGTGLGLAIADEIVRRHCGHIEVNSRGVPEEGSCFTVWLPTRQITTD